MRNRILIALVAAVAVMGISVSSASANGVCGGGGNISSLVKGWQRHGAINQAIEIMGSHVHLDGNAMQIASKGLVWVTVTKGTWVHNTTCVGHGFKSIGQRKYVPPGSRIPVPASEAPAPGKKGVVRNSFDPNCGNLHPNSLIHVRRAAPKHKKHKAKKKAAPAPSCQSGPNKSSNSQCVNIVTEGPKTSGAGNCNSTNSGNLSGVGEAQGSCNVVVVNCQGTGSCAPETTNICTAAGSGGTGTTGGTGGTGTAEACKEEVVVIPPCGCEPPPPPPPPCETCECRKECKPPPTPPTITFVTTLNDVDAEAFSENFGVKAEVPGNDTGVVVISPRYGSFGPQGGTQTITFTGTFSRSWTYYAPTEVPPGGMDRMTVTLRDTTTGLSATPDVQEFRINPVPGSPG